MAKATSVFFCQECGCESPRWMGRCPGCAAWNTFVEERHSKKERKSAAAGKQAKSSPCPITSVIAEQQERLQTGIGEFDRALGGGIMPASAVLLTGDPGIGKSTLLLQVAGSLARRGHTLLYVSGEESAYQIKLRGERLQACHPNLLLAPETDLSLIREYIDASKPEAVVVDSVQTIYDPLLTSSPGSISQVRDGAASLITAAKEKGIAMFLVGHVTKEGLIAGPKVLEHMVDCVLTFEGERHHSYRILRTVKNRFGTASEIGVFTMEEKGLREVTNPSEFFVTQRVQDAAGSVVVASMEGTRPLLVEIQSLVTPSRLPAPRRMATGLDYNRVSLIMAVLEKKTGLFLHDHDAFVKVVGGVRLEEPAVDLGLAVSLASGFKNRPVGKRDIFIGEVGLTGEIRSVNRVPERVREGMRLGFNRFFVPAPAEEKVRALEGLDLIPVATLDEALGICLGG